MSRPAIHIENVSKLYRLGTFGYRTLRESLSLWWARRRGVNPPSKRLPQINPAQLGPDPNTFWAVRNISASIQPGEIVGVVGRNGAGKSTLLKVLSRITEPTEGRVTLRGRVGSLLEVGAGFHPELSGIDNIFLNGAILGMKRADIARKLDAIIDFADVGAFIDTPVKRYSSGMYVRLAFAVAAHLEPDILIVDEVLAVGDMRFQKKCLGKMQEISSGHGRTVVFVSHNLEAVQRLCSHCMLLEHGQLTQYGATDEVVSEYLGANQPFAPAETWIDLASAKRSGSGEAKFSQLRFTSGNSLVSGQPYSDGPFECELAVDCPAPLAFQSIAFAFLDQHSRVLVNADVGSLGQTFKLLPGRTVFRIRVEALHLKPDLYFIALWLARYAGQHSTGNDTIDWIEKACELKVTELHPETDRTSVGYTGPVTCKFKVIDVLPANEADQRPTL